MVYSTNEDRQNFLKITWSKSFSKLDVRYGYYNIMKVDDSRKYTTSTTEYGKNELHGESLSIYAAPSYFALMINESLSGVDFCFVYVNDIIITSKLEKKY